MAENVEREPCPHCGKRIPITATACPYCGEDPERPARPDATGGLIPYKNPAALWAYYLAIFSLLPCFPIGVAAFVLGLKGLKAVRERPAVRGTAHAWIGIVLGGLCGFVWLAGLVFALATGLFTGGR